MNHEAHRAPPIGMRKHQTADVAPQRSGVLTHLAAAGVVGPIIFTAGFLVQELLRRGEYEPMAEPVSALEAGPNGGVQQVNSLCSASDDRLRGGDEPRGQARASRGRGSADAWLEWRRASPCRCLSPARGCAGVTVDPNGVHTANGAIFFLISGCTRRDVATARGRPEVARPRRLCVLATGHRIAGPFRERAACWCDRLMRRFTLGRSGATTVLRHLVHMHDRPCAAPRRVA